MVCFHTKNPTLGKFWRALKWKMLENVGMFYDHLEYFTVDWYSLWPFGVIYGHF
jgi:hypothetical protein